MKVIKPEHEAKLKAFTASHNGKPLDQKALLRANPMVAKVIVARFVSMTPQQQAAIKKIVTPETVESLKILLPEAKGIFDFGIKLINRRDRNG